MSFKSFLNGVTIGLVLGFLFAPSSGQETRRRLARKARDAKDTYDDIAEIVEEKFECAKAKINELRGKSEAAYEKVEDNNAANLFE